MTGVEVTIYLLYLQNYSLAALTVALFAPLIGLHFAIDRLSSDKSYWDQRGRVIKIRPSKYKLID